MSTEVTAARPIIKADNMDFLRSSIPNAPANAIFEVPNQILRRYGIDLANERFNRSDVSVVVKGISKDAA